MLQLLSASPGAVRADASRRLCHAGDSRAVNLSVVRADPGGALGGPGALTPCTAVSGRWPPPSTSHLSSGATCVKSWGDRLGTDCGPSERALCPRGVYGTWVWRVNAGNRDRVLPAMNQPGSHTKPSAARVAPVPGPQHPQSSLGIRPPSHPGSRLAGPRAAHSARVKPDQVVAPDVPKE